jgi:hypothetical protein
MWAWVCDAMTPVVFVLLTVVGLFNEGGGGGGLLAKAVVIGIGLIAPVAGLILGIEARRRAEPSGTAAAVVAGVLIVAMPVALFLLVI